MTIKNQLEHEFKAALAAHDLRAKQPHTGPFHFSAENDRIGAVRLRVKEFLDLADDLVIGNEALLKRLEDVR